MGIPAYYFDGKTSRRHSVEITVQAGVVRLSGDVDLECPTDGLRVSERVRNGARKVTFPDGAYLEVLDNAAFNETLALHGYRDSAVVRIQQSWRGSVATLLATVLILVLGYLYGIPAASKAAAFAMPANIERSIGKESLAFLDSRLFEPTQLPPERREAITRRFKTLALAQQDAPPFEIAFRKSRIGPNAFALPSGQIILTDEIVLLMENDDAVMGILAHELGHIHERHLLRRMIQSSAIAALTTVLFGDVSAVVANVPTVMMDMKYSRDAERDADDYAVALLKANRMDLSSLAHVFEKLGAKGDSSVPYISSHPSSSERIERIKQQ